VVARAPQATPLIGFLHSSSPSISTVQLRAFHRGLGEAGFVAGRNVSIEYRWAEDQNERLPAMAGDLVSRQVTVIFAAPAAAAIAAKSATTTIPIVFTGGIDPVAAGLVSGFSHPGGNVTGVSNLNVALGSKRIELMHEIVPAATTMAYLVNPTNPNVQTVGRDAQAAARTLGLELHLVQASTGAELDAAVASLAELHAGALVIGPDPFFNGQSQHLAALAMRHAVPAISGNLDFPAAGGLMSYGGGFAEAYRVAGVQTGQVLKGAKPSDLPVEQVVKVELFINLKAAKALGITVPITLLGRADEVIE
jgi:putative tryptophan/tyrosine transport system substrate-binding protein